MQCGEIRLPCYINGATLWIAWSSVRNHRATMPWCGVPKLPYQPSPHRDDRHADEFCGMRTTLDCTCIPAVPSSYREKGLVSLRPVRSSAFARQCALIDDHFSLDALESYMLFSPDPPCPCPEDPLSYLGNPPFGLHLA